MKKGDDVVDMMQCFRPFIIPVILQWIEYIYCDPPLEIDVANMSSGREVWSILGYEHNATIFCDEHSARVAKVSANACFIPFIRLPATP